VVVSLQERLCRKPSIGPVRLGTPRDLLVDSLTPLQVRQLAPGHMKRRGGRATSIHVTCAMFSRHGEIVATYNDEASS
jgi:hypothetical protein